ncbi:MAG: helix-turn-helix transcriptional regulator [Oscillospiraceae bacterium]|nr:helix-turn-helix transcriptional regulator [Oscillospiraceae bacterium]
MNENFPRIITLLRTERKLTQKQASEKLDISQALLSHYERGIRECGLDFLVKTADFYGVSVDYLLGRSIDRNGALLTVEDIPEPDLAQDNRLRGSAVPILNKKLIANSLNILFAMLQQAQCKALTSQVSLYLMVCVYKMFRVLYLSAPKNSKNFFSAADGLARGLSTAALEVLEAKIAIIASGKDVGEMKGFENSSSLEMSEEEMQKAFPLFMSSLLNLIKNAETEMGIYIKKS